MAFVCQVDDFCFVVIPLGWLPPDGEGFCYIDVAMARSDWFPRLSAVSTCFLFLFGALFIILWDRT